MDEKELYNKIERDMYEDESTFMKGFCKIFADTPYHMRNGLLPMIESVFAAAGNIDTSTWKKGYACHACIRVEDENGKKVSKRCDASFMSNDALRAHVRRIHLAEPTGYASDGTPNVRGFKKCPICEKEAAKNGSPSERDRLALEKRIELDMLTAEGKKLHNLKFHRELIEKAEQVRKKSNSRKRKLYKETNIPVEQRELLQTPPEKRPVMARVVDDPAPKRRKMEAPVLEKLVIPAAVPVVNPTVGPSLGGPALGGGPSLAAGGSFVGVSGPSTYVSPHLPPLADLPVSDGFSLGSTTGLGTPPGAQGQTFDYCLSPIHM